MKIVISGGGIAGLTLAITAKKAGHFPIIIQHRDALDQPSFGGGIGLWPPSQMVMERLGVLDQLEQNGYYMPSASYYNSKGVILGHPSSNFYQKFPVVCLQRQQLSISLYKKCKQLRIQVHTNTSILNAVSEKQGVSIQLSTGQNIRANILIGADGIGSKIRSLIMKQSGLPQVIPYHCQYAYFRAVLDLGNDTSSEWHKHAFESWDEKKRFGYVPLKSPKTFWFVAIPIGEEGLQKVIGSHICTQEHKQWILKQFHYWKGPINIKKLIQMTPAPTILRTDISKIKDVSSFPWHSKHKNMILLGDAANATAPNLAQGAGLAIESAWDFISMVNLNNLSGLDQYMKKRRKRAQIVQGMADLVAKVGQLKNPYSKIRNFCMSTGTIYLKSLQQRIFEEIVKHSLGGDSGKLYWMPPNIPLYKFHKNIRQENCILSKLMGVNNFNKLPQATQKFRSSLVGYGKGRVNVQSLWPTQLLGMPKNMADKPFGANVETYYNEDGISYQNWQRIFGQGEVGAVKYSTIHRAIPHLGVSKTGFILSQTLGLGPDIFRFGYLPKVNDNIIHYQSKGLWIRNYKLPLPNFLIPTSQWTQQQTENGWKFNGRICLPKILGSFPLMKYKGTFQPIKYSQSIEKKSKRVIIAGGSGMIGSIVAREFYLKGWTVQILSRNPKPLSHLPFVKVHQWNPSHYSNQKQVQSLVQVFENADAIINLSGENPGAGLWNDKSKRKILESRLNSIKLISSALQKLYKQEPLYLQASAAGVYGNRKDQVLFDDADPGHETTFRTQTCKQIQNLTKQLCSEAGILRIGHVLSSKGGLFPSLQLASKMRAGKFGKGNQFAPWVHIEDLANSIVFISENFSKFKGKTINIASPNHKTYDEILSTLAKVRERRMCIVPVPQSLLKWSLGQISSVLFDSQRMYPKLLLQNGCEFKYKDLQTALTSKQCL